MTTLARRVTYTATALAAGAAAAAFLSGHRAVHRRDSYRVLFRQGPFELREYPHNDLTVATTGPRLVSAGEPPATQQLVAYRYSSWPAPDREATAVQNLRDWAGVRGYPVEGRPVIAYYDADWTPPILRRNEVLLRLRN
ncbi:MAG: hypothetical protein WD690_11870 [Vicinamibacterales bacterium]